MLRDEEHGAAPLAADGEALHEAEQHEEDGRAVPDLGVGRQRAHEEGRDADQDEGELQQALAAELVAVVAEDEATDRAGDEADGEGAEGEQGAGDRVGGGEEHRREDDRGRDAVEEEVVPLDGGAEHAGRDDADDRTPLGGRRSGFGHGGHERRH